MPVAKKWRTARDSAIFEPGEIIVHAGDEVHFLGVVLEGKIAASAPTQDGGQQALGHFGPGETFGEMALMSGDPVLADLIGGDASRVMLVPLTLFQSHIMAEPRAVQHISRTIGARFQQVMSDPAKAAAVTRKEDVAGLLELKGERPERILVLNCGSSSLKYSFFDTEHPENAARGHIERIGAERHAARAARGEGRSRARIAAGRLCGGIRGDACGAHGPRRGRDPRRFGDQRRRTSRGAWRGEVHRARC